MQPLRGFSPFRTDKSWYEQYWLAPETPERAAPARRPHWIAAVLRQMRPRFRAAAKPSLADSACPVDS
jgi:hypothetical protein